MPPKNVAPTAAIRRFWCDICAKGYPRQPDYENHLRSYDHNHRQRMVDMRKLTAQTEAETGPQKKRGLDDMRAMPLDGSTKKSAPRFTKITNDPNSRFKKVGTSNKAGETGEAISENKGNMETKENKAVPDVDLMKPNKQNDDLSKQIEDAGKASEGQTQLEVIHIEKDEVTWEEHPLMARIRAGGDPLEGLSPGTAASLREVAVRYELI